MIDIEEFRSIEEIKEWVNSNALKDVSIFPFGERIVCYGTIKQKKIPNPERIYNIIKMDDGITREQLYREAHLPKEELNKLIANLVAQDLIEVSDLRPKKYYVK